MFLLFKHYLSHPFILPHFTLPYLTLPYVIILYLFPSHIGMFPCVENNKNSILKLGGYVFVVRSLRRSLTTSFGSICLGSLIVAVLRLLTGIVSVMVDRMRKLHNSVGELIYFYFIYCFLYFHYFHYFYFHFYHLY